jgi:acyl-CoA synthetase (NDP forming)
MTFDRLLNPRSIAVFGGAHAEELIRQNDRLGYTGEIWPVHPRKTQILGRKVYRSVGELPGSPDAAYLGVNRQLTVELVGELAARGAGGVVCYASGFAEAGREGAELAKRLLAASGDMPLVGPNCYGLINYLDGAVLWPDQQGGRRVEKGVAIITQSSNIGFNLTMQRRGLPVAYMISLGNRLKLDLGEAMRIFAQRAEVTAIGLFLETISDPRAFEEAANFARDLGKPVVAIKIGRSDRAQKLVVSHTASLAGTDAVASALFERLGVARVGSLEAFIEALKVLHVHGPLEGGRVGAMSTSGGDLILLADNLGAGLELPVLSAPVIEDLRGKVHERVAAANPLDYQMFTWDDEERLYRCFAAFMGERFDVALCVLDYPRADLCDQSTWGGAERAFVRASRDTETRGAVLATFVDNIAEPVAERLMNGGVAMLSGIDAGLAGVRAAVEIGAAWRRPADAPLLVRRGRFEERSVAQLDEPAAKQLLGSHGVPVPKMRIVQSAGEAAAAAAEIGFPVAVKATGIAHKTEAGGVRLDLGSPAEVESAVERMSGLCETFLVEQMITGAVAELLVGVAHEEQLGPYLMVGAGGNLVEVMRDSAVILLPTDRDRVVQALQSLKCAPLFGGFRGAPPADLDAAVEVIMTIADLVERGSPSIIELDVNPLMLLPAGRGAVAADALVRLCGNPAGDA